MASGETIRVENAHTPPFFVKIPVSVERGAGVYVWDEEGRRYVDFTSGWGVTCLGHAHPAITEALLQLIHEGLRRIGKTARTYAMSCTMSE